MDKVTYSNDLFKAVDYEFSEKCFTLSKCFESPVAYPNFRITGMSNKDPSQVYVFIELSSGELTALKLIRKENGDYAIYMNNGFKVIPKPVNTAATQDSELKKLLQKAIGENPMTIVRAQDIRLDKEMLNCLFKLPRNEKIGVKLSEFNNYVFYLHHQTICSLYVVIFRGCDYPALYDVTYSEGEEKFSVVCKHESQFYC